MVKILRKVWRLGALFFPILYLFQPKEILLLISGILLAVFIFLEIYRLTHPKINRKVYHKLHWILKEKERNKITTSTLFILALFLTILFFPKEIAVIALVFLIFGDSAAEIIGLRFGTFKLIGNKSLQGSLGCFIFCLIFGLIFAYYLQVAFGIVLIGSLAVTIIELIPVKIDDNFTIPLVSALVMFLL